MNIAPPFTPEEAFATANLDGDKRFLIICDHASNDIPAAFDNLGLSDEILQTHIAYDPGAVEVARAISEGLGCPLIESRFSRLLIDPNRGLDDPTLVMKLSDGSIIPGNRRVDPYQQKAEWQHRIDAYYKPYDSAIAQAVAAAQADKCAPIILSVHSFTDNWRGFARPWEAGVLWDKDPRLAELMLRYMGQFDGLTFGDNEPYTGRRAGETLYRHGTKNGLAHAIIELRQNQIETAQQQAFWAARLVDFMRHAVSQEALTKVTHYGSVTDV